MNHNAPVTKFIITHGFSVNFHDKFYESPPQECTEKAFFLKAANIKSKYGQEEVLIITPALASVLEQTYQKHDACKNMLLELCCLKPAPKGDYHLDQAIAISNELPEKIIIITDVPSETEKIGALGQLAMTTKAALDLLCNIEKQLESDSKGKPVTQG